MRKLEYLKQIQALLLNPDPDSLKLSLADTHQKGIFSLVIAGKDFGKLTRVFISENKLKPYKVQLHTHRYPVKITTLKGNVKHHVAIPQQQKGIGVVELSEFEYRSPLNGGSGLKYISEGFFMLNEYTLPIGSTTEMSEREYHTMSCSTGSIWIVEEQGFKTESSRVLGIPFITTSLYNEPKMFQVNDMCQIVAKELKKIILDYETTN
jgi:hypothetical protein